MDYALPRANEFPDIEVELLEVPCLSNPLGVNGADGVTHIDMPATPERVWRAMALAKAA
jgi:carbon-monoxide dehydrogenase large subunit